MIKLLFPDAYDSDDLVARNVLPSRRSTRTSGQTLAPVGTFEIGMYLFRNENISKNTSRPQTHTALTESIDYPPVSRAG